MFSMTGYGSGTAEAKDFTVRTELQSYNHRFLDIRVRIPGEYQSLEGSVRKVILGRLARGRVNVHISFQQSGDRYRVVINEPLAKKYWNALKRLERLVDNKAAIGTEVLIGLPGVLEATSGIPSVREFKKQFGLSLGLALEKLLAMRRKEGVRMAAALSRHLNLLARGLGRARSRLEKKERDRRKRGGGKNVQNAVNESSAGVNVQEELARMESHISQFRECLVSPEPVGKTLEFICQEMLREVTTLGDKAADSAVSRQIVIMKSELESLREQARNVE